MLRILGRGTKPCDGISRRNFLALGAFGATLTLADAAKGLTSTTTHNGFAHGGLAQEVGERARRERAPA